MFKKILVVGVFTAVIALGLGGASTASADHGHHNDGPDCFIEATNSIDPVCWNYVIWGGVANGWIPRTPFLFGFNTYFLLNHFQFYNIYNPYFFGHPSHPGVQNHPHLNNPNYGNVHFGYWSNNLWWPYF